MWAATCADLPLEEVLKNISFTLRQGEKVAVVGPNGCGNPSLVVACKTKARRDFRKPARASPTSGKSTLVKALVNDLDKSGRVEGRSPHR